MTGRRLVGAILLAVAGSLGCSGVGMPGPQEPVPPTTPAPTQPETTPSDPAAADPTDPVERRVLWVVRGTLTHPDSIRAMVRRASDAGFNTLLVQVRGRGDAYYASSFEPYPDLLTFDGPPDFDPLMMTVDAAHAAGLEVHAWMNMHLVQGMGPLPSDRDHLVHARPDLLAVPEALAAELYGVDPFDPSYLERLHRYARDNPDQLEGIYTSPANVDVQEHIERVVGDVLDRYPVDGIHLDYIRYPSPDFDYSRGALDAFRRVMEPRLGPGEQERMSRAARSDPLVYANSYPEDWGDFRRAQITRTVERVRRQIRNRRPEATLSAAVFANAEDARRSRYQDWHSWLRSGTLDVAVPMAYTPDNRFFRRQIASAVGVVGPDRVWAGIGVYQTTLRGTLDKIEIARELGAGGISLFSYDWAVSEGRSDRRDTPFLDRVGQEAFGRR